MAIKEADAVHESVKEHYGRRAETESGTPVVDIAACCGTDDCCPDNLSDQLYQIDLSSVPADIANFSMGCGDPISLAALEKGQHVLDLGSGGGLDCFLAAQRVGPDGYVIGIDMTPKMLEKARANKAKLGLDNVDFREGQIEDLPVEDSSIDVLISNCVINLSPDKAAVFREAYRVLRPGGRLAVSDMITLGTYSDAERANQAAWSACVTGAEDISQINSYMKAAGFESISIRPQGSPDVELLSAAHLPDSPTELISARITAVKPA